MLINVLEYLEATAARLPDRPAVIDPDGAITFAELVNESRNLAGRIAAQTTAQRQPIGVYLPKSKPSIVAFAAILYSGNCYAPLDLKSPVSRMAGLFKRLEPALVITESAQVTRLRSAGLSADQILCLDEIASETQGIHGIPESIDTDPAYIIHTSGSTGVPKGVVISHRSIIDYVDWARKCYGVNEEDTIGNQAPFHFDNSTLDIYLSWSCGATLVLIPEEHFLFPATLISYIREQSIRLIFWVPSVLKAIATLDVLSQSPLPDLKKILFAGEVMPTRYLNYWRKWFPMALFSNLYGPTEITVDCTYYVVNRELRDDEPLPIGFPCRNTDVLILNENNQRARPGERGELCVRGSSLALGYWNEPEVTAAVFCQNPQQNHYPERIYRTGDLVYTNEQNEICFAGRNDQQIKLQGHRIELGEIEAAALHVPGILNACAIWEKANCRIILVYESATVLAPRDIRVALCNFLPKYMLPSTCIRMPSLPLNANGKIDRQLLAKANLGGDREMS